MITSNLGLVKIFETGFRKVFKKINQKYFVIVFQKKQQSFLVFDYKLFQSWKKYVPRLFNPPTWTLLLKQLRITLKLRISKDSITFIFSTNQIMHLLSKSIITNLLHVLLLLFKIFWTKTKYLKMMELVVWTEYASKLQKN